jgi:nucleoside phosphorylase/tetratricopeptide (TPR) repeat protein
MNTPRSKSKGSAGDGGSNGGHVSLNAAPVYQMLLEAALFPALTSNRLPVPDSLEGAELRDALAQNGMPWLRLLHDWSVDHGQIPLAASLGVHQEAAGRFTIDTTGFYEALGEICRLCPLESSMPVRPQGESGPVDRETWAGRDLPRMPRDRAREVQVTDRTPWMAIDFSAKPMPFDEPSAKRSRGGRPSRNRPAAEPPQGVPTFGAPSLDLSSGEVAGELWVRLDPKYVRATSERGTPAILRTLAILGEGRLELLRDRLHEQQAELDANVVAAMNTHIRAATTWHGILENAASRIDAEPDESKRSAVAAQVLEALRSVSLFDDQLRDALDRMLPAEFERLLVDSNAPQQHLRLTGVSRSQQVNDLLQWAAEDPERLGRIASLVNAPRAPARSRSADSEPQVDRAVAVARDGDSRLDVVILTAISLEYREVLRVEDGLWPGSAWREEQDPDSGLPIAFGAFQGRGGQPLRIAVAHAGEMGAMNAAMRLSLLVQKYRPSCVAMAGVCAGRPGKTNLGDVIAAERLFLHDTGKQLPSGVQQDLKTYNLSPSWKVAIESFGFASRFRSAGWFTSRPTPYEWQENWLLAQLYSGVQDPSALPEHEHFCPQFGTVIEQLWLAGDIEDATHRITEKGRSRIERILIKHMSRIPDLSPSGEFMPFRVHVAPMGSGNRVVEDEEIWGFVSNHMRKTLGLEMEATAIGAVANEMGQRLDSLVMKGVMDFANHGRDDHFKEFAARASAECLIAFLREQLETKAALGKSAGGPTEPRANRAQPLAPRISLEHLPKTSGNLLGREKELRLLDEAWAETGRTHAVVLVAGGGVGKTALVKRWLERVKADDWRGAERVYAWSFYSQGTSDDRQASEDAFLDEALRWFEVAYDPAASAADKGGLLARAVARQRTLLVLDGVEPLQHPPGPQGGRLRAPGVAALLNVLVSAGHPGLALLTTRERLTDLDEYERSAEHPTGAVIRHDLGNLTPEDGARLLHRLGVRRAGAGGIGDDDVELLQVSQEVGGHALALTLLGRYLSQAHGGDVRKRDQVSFEAADAETQGGHAFRVMEAYGKWLGSGGESGQRALAVMRLLGLFDRPAEAGCLAALRRAPAIGGLTEALVGLGEAKWNLALTRLVECGLVLPQSEGGAGTPAGMGGGRALDAHPLVREHFARRLRKEQPEAWREGHRRLYEHLKGSVPHRPEGLAGLQPLYQAVAHGCHAGLHQEACDEVYVDRILRGTGAGGFYSKTMLGAIGDDLGAVSCFFEEPWTRLAPGLTEAVQSWLLNEAGLSLRALGRLSEARELMRAGLEIDVRRQNWKNAATAAGNVSELELTLGEVTAALRDAEESVGFADRSKDAFVRMGHRTTLADALHQAGRSGEALGCFREAEAMQGERQSQYPLLYSFQGFRYCDLLLSAVERAACLHWLDRVTAAASGSGPEAVGSGRQDLSAHGEGLCSVEERAAHSLAVATKHHLSLLTIALDHLTLGRAALYRAILEVATLPEPYPSAVAKTASAPALATARQYLTAAVDGLRAAGQQDDIPRGLVSRAWLRMVGGDEGGARADLDEAWRIAERGLMRLHMANILLHRARLFRDKPALARARILVEQCGYHRRDGELADTEVAARAWPDIPPQRAGRQ